MGVLEGWSDFHVAMVGATAALVGLAALVLALTASALARIPTIAAAYSAGAFSV